MVESSVAKTVSMEFMREVQALGGKTVSLCFQCGTCSASCPSGRHTAFRTRQLIRKVQLGFKPEVLEADELWYCATCYTCYERCPRGVEIVDIIMILRNMAVKSGYMAPAHQRVATVLFKTGHMVPLTDEFKALRASLGLPDVPNTILKNADALQQFQDLVKSCGFDKLLASK